MNKKVKIISILLSIVLTAVFPLGCGSQGVTTTVTPEDGATIEFDGITLTIPPGALSEETEIAIRPEKMPSIFSDLTEEEAELLSSEIQTLGDYYDIDLDASTLNTPITVQLQYSEGDIPEGFNEDGLFIVHSHDGEYELLPTNVDTENRTVSVEVSEFSGFFALLVAGGLVITVISLIPLTLQGLKKAAAQKKFNETKADYEQNHQNWDSKTRQQKVQQMQKLAEVAKIDFDPESLPAAQATPPPPTPQETARQQFEQLKAKYIAKFKDGKLTVEEAGKWRAELKGLARLGNIDFDPSTLPPSWWEGSKAQEENEPGVGLVGSGGTGGACGGPCP